MLFTKNIVESFKIDPILTYTEILHQVLFSVSEIRVKKHIDKGKLLVRERIQYLLDRDSSFVELSPLAAYGMYENNHPSAGIITGLGYVSGNLVMIIANDATVKGGTYVKETIKKHLRALEIASNLSLPCIYLVDSGGIFLPRQAEVFADKEHFGRIFFLQSRLSAMSIPQIAIVMGSCTAGGAYIPAMSDEVIIVKNQGSIFLAGPPLVKAATGEETNTEDLGGAQVHAAISGVADYIANDDYDALDICKKIFDAMPSAVCSPLLNKFKSETNPSILDALVSLHENAALPMNNIIKAVCDENSFVPFKEQYGTTILTGMASIQGFKCGIIANNGILFSESALKAVHFIELCSHRKVPIIFLHNITGFMVGKEFEHKGIAKDGAKLVHAVANTNVPKITLIVGNSYGAGNYAMAGRAYNPDFLFIWPNAQIAVMGANQADFVMNSVNNKSSEAARNTIKDNYAKESQALYSTANLWDDGIILPSQSRDVLAFSLSAVSNKKINAPSFGIYRM